MFRSPTVQNSSRRRGPGRALRLAAAVLAALALTGVAGACGGSDDDDEGATTTSTELGGPVLTDSDQVVVSVLLGFVRLANEQRQIAAGCADQACRDAAGDVMVEAADAVARELDGAGEPSACFAEVSDRLREAVDAAGDGGEDAIEAVRTELTEASQAAGAC